MPHWLAGLVGDAGSAGAFCRAWPCAVTTTPHVPLFTTRPIPHNSLRVGLPQPRSAARAAADWAFRTLPGFCFPAA